MKELLTKNFWRGVKKTYDDALNPPSPEENKALEPPSEANPQHPPPNPDHEEGDRS
jgi:hypothetical protein